eukprot:TRINITY_DN3845_c0_g1_i1.p1 TRINITY_DN3845_c0_g1~~TRINITY_DN3845_c0_g1_i1.p1  ORF type:complete len:218 (-),score=24.46 TRINITY_DN3845_c0_g1_i1:33-686(-)
MMIRALKGLLFLLLAGAASAMLPSIQGVFSRRFGPMDPPPPPPTPPSPPSSCMGGGSITAFVGEDCFYDESLSGTSQTKLEFSVYSLFTDDFSVETGYTCSAGGDCPAGFTVKVHPRVSPSSCMQTSEPQLSTRFAKGLHHRMSIFVFRINTSAHGSAFSYPRFDTHTLPTHSLAFSWPRPDMTARIPHPPDPSPHAHPTSPPPRPPPQHPTTPATR